MEALDKLKAVARDPYAYGANLKKNAQKPVIGNFCSYTPEEFITAAGAVPFRLFGTREDISLADAHLQSYCCSLVRGGLEDALRGNLKFLDGAVFPHTCDSIQRLSDIWRLNGGFPLHLDVVLPVKLDTASARDYMTDVLNDFRAGLASALNRSISDEDLRRTISLYNRLRRTLGEIYALRSENPDVISASDLFLVVKAAMIMDREELEPLLATLLKGLAREAGPGPAGKRKRLFLSGGICNHPDIYGVLAASGGEVVWDDLCTGTRYFEGDIDESGDPVAAIADRYLTRIICPAKHAGTIARGERLTRLVKEKQAAGVVFLFLKFCDPHSFDYPYLKKYLDAAGVPSLLMEVEEQLPSEAQLQTRFETFIDMI